MIRRRIRTITLWTGTTLCVLIAAGFVASGWWLIGLNTQGGFVVFAESGTLVIGFDPVPDPPSLILHRHNEGLSGWLSLGKWEATLFIPLVYVFLTVAVPTLLVWRFVPKFPRGHCRRCGYNLTGLSEARCPECGTGFDGSKQKRARHGGHREREGAWRMAKYGYYFVEGYVVRWRRPGKPQWLAPDGQWREYSDEWDVMTNGRALADEQEALETAEAKFEQNKEWWDKQYPQYQKRGADS